MNVACDYEAPMQMLTTEKYIAGGKPECGTHVFVQLLEQCGCRQVELVKVTYSRCCLSFSADKIMRGTRFQSQPMKVWFPASSSAFSSLFFI